MTSILLRLQRRNMKTHNPNLLIDFCIDILQTFSTKTKTETRYYPPKKYKPKFLLQGLKLIKVIYIS